MKFSKIFSGNFADPTILAENGKYYMTCSSFKYFPGLSLYESSDLKCWKKLKNLVSGGVKDIWSPELCKIGERYFVYFSADGENYALFSDRMDGEWSAVRRIGAKGLIDPGYIREEETGENWLFFSGGYAARLSDYGFSLKSAPEKIYPFFDIPQDWECEGIYPESPKLFRRGEYYYLTIAQGGTAGPPTSHMSVMMRSKSLQSGWELSPYNPILHTRSALEPWWSVGHATPFYCYDGKWRMILHGYRRSQREDGRMLLLCDASWDKENWLFAEDTTLAPCPQVKRNFDFAKMSDHSVFEYFSYYGQSIARRTECTGQGLSLHGCGEGLCDCMPLLYNDVGGDYEMEVSLRTDSDDAFAGITFYYNEACFVGIGVKRGCLCTFNRGETHDFGAISANAITLKVRKKRGVVSYFYDDGKGFVKLPVSDDVSGFHHNVYGGFLSLRPGMFCAGKAIAIFSAFSIKEC